MPGKMVLYLPGAKKRLMKVLREPLKRKTPQAKIHAWKGLLPVATQLRGTQRKVKQAWPLKMPEWKPTRDPYVNYAELQRGVMR